ncbi:Magnetosome protein MamF [Candidatus Magnetaquicoccaceae bacterium FCR-1]|uniref:Magnetosome protein MamF n=1 Tax=Candidatus Magnetaquiglobus chichijimensis TaxID=3141448 RepID=A0ABQ0CAE5_9PROT
MKNRLLAAFSYLGVLCLVPLLMESKEPFVLFHARQGLVLWVWTVLSYFAMHLPGLGPYLFSTSTVLVLFLSMFGLFSVVMNQRWRIPVIATLGGIPAETTSQD